MGDVFGGRSPGRTAADDATTILRRRRGRGGRRRRRWWRTSPITTSEEAEAAARWQVQGLAKCHACRGATRMLDSVPGREPRPAEARLDEAQP
eukprot:155719-Pyramimonas_sp.AAC.1